MFLRSAILLRTATTVPDKPSNRQWTWRLSNRKQFCLRNGISQTRKSNGDFFVFSRLPNSVGTVATLCGCAMAAEKPEVVLSQEGYELDSKFQRRFICFRGRRVQWYNEDAVRWTTEVAIKIKLLLVARSPLLLPVWWFIAQCRHCIHRTGRPRKHMNCRWNFESSSCPSWD